LWIGYARAADFNNLFADDFCDRVATVNEAYSPTREELEYHLGLVGAYEEAKRNGIGAVGYRGDHIDAAHYRTSLAFLGDARRIGLLEGEL